MSFPAVFQVCYHCEKRVKKKKGILAAMFLQA